MDERRQRLYRTEAIVLKRRDFGEADRILTVFTPEHGKLTLLAKGVRKTKSRKAGHVELFTDSMFLVAKGRTWDLVSQAEMVEPFRALHEDLLRAGYAYTVAEILDGFTQERDSHPPMFVLLKETLSRLAASKDEMLPLVARYFDLHMLGMAGYQPQLFRCVECQELLEPATNYVSVAEGGVLCPRHGEGRIGAEPLPLPLFKTLRFIQTREWDVVARLDLSEGLQAELERLLQSMLIYHLERNLRSVAFLRTVRDG